MTIVLQRGHCYRITGATGAPGEQKFTEACAEIARMRIHDLGHMVRIINADEPLERYKGDMFFAFHYDSSTNPTASGASVGHQTPEGAEIGRLWKMHYRANGWTRAFKNDNYTSNLAKYYGVRNAVRVGNRRAIIIEAGFHSNTHDAAMMTPEMVAMATAATVVDVLGGKCPPSTTPIAFPAYPGTVRMGDVGTAVRVWQEQLTRRGYIIVVDGIFGPATNHVVRDWQYNHGLVVDGICGPATWHSLLFG